MALVRRWIHVPVPIPTGRAVALGAVLGAVAALPLLRGWAMTYGATDAELVATLPGDDVVPRASTVATRAITIAAEPEDVWPWLVQLGQGRGGFYSYDWLENAVGLGIHSADRIEPRWQALAVGDLVHLAEEVALRAVVVEPGRALVLQGAVAPGDGPPPYDFTWAFVLAARPFGMTRLVVRERYGYTRRFASLIVEPAQAVSFLMTTRMLRGIRDRAERTAGTTPPPPD